MSLIWLSQKWGPLQHRLYFLPDPNQNDLFPELPREPSVICRASQAKEPIEWQADYFSACLLMPRGMVVAAWQQQTGLSPYVMNRGIHEMVLKASDGPLTPDFAATQLARRFKVSNQAIRIRLEELNLLQPRGQGSLFSAQIPG